MCWLCSTTLQGVAVLLHINVVLTPWETAPCVFITTPPIVTPHILVYSCHSTDHNCVTLVLLPPLCVELVSGSGVFPNHKASTYSCTNVALAPCVAVSTQLSPNIPLPLCCINRMDFPLSFSVWCLFCGTFFQLHPDTWCAARRDEGGWENDRLLSPLCSARLCWHDTVSRRAAEKPGVVLVPMLRRGEEIQTVV